MALQPRLLRQHRRKQIAKVVRGNDGIDVLGPHHLAAPHEIREQIKIRRRLPMIDPRIDEMKAVPLDANECPAIVGVGADYEDAHERSLYEVPPTSTGFGFRLTCYASAGKAKAPQTSEVAWIRRRKGVFWKSIALTQRQSSNQHA
jgi:hypothetical protein